MSVLDLLIGGGNLAGLDLGQSAVKMCSLGKGRKGLYSLKSFGFTPLSESAIFEEEVNNKAEVIDAIKATQKNGKIGTKDFCYGMTGSSCVVKTMKAPEGSKEEIEDFINWEAEQFIPFGIENAELSMHILDKTNDENRDVIMAAAKLPSLADYEVLFSSAGVKLKKIDLQVLALINAFEYNYQEYLDEYRKGTLLIDFGAQSTKIVVYKNGAPLLAKSILIGGVNATEEIQKEVGLDFKEAEDLKKTKTESGNPPQEVISAVNNVVQNILNKINDAVTFYTAAGSEDRIYHCFVTGGSVQLPGIYEGLSNSLDLSIEVMDPLRRISLSKNVSEQLVEYITYSGAASIGLALRNFD